jgi:hypothetical protein
MKPRHFTLLIANLALSLGLLSGLSSPAAGQEPIAPTFYVSNTHQMVEVRKADGSISSAEFLAEIILLPDGRANGGFGLLERGTPDVLSLYRVSEGRVSSDRRTGPTLEFTAHRLSPLPEAGIQGSLLIAKQQARRQIISPDMDPAERLANPELPAVPADGSVRFLLDPVDPGGTFSFEANGRVLQLPPDSLPDFDLGYINAPPQTVVAQTPRGSYSAFFENVALVFPSVGAIGLLALSPTDNAPGSNQGFGRWEVSLGHISTHEDDTRVLLHAHAANTRTPGGEITVTIRPDTDRSEPCRIYDWVGTQVHASFEAQAVITVFRN